MSRHEHDKTLCRAERAERLGPRPCRSLAGPAQRPDSAGPRNSCAGPCQKFHARPVSVLAPPKLGARVFENSPLDRARLIAKADHLAQQNALLKEELRIKDARMGRIDPAQRPHYPPFTFERLAILALRAATGWNATETARRFFLAPATIAAWLRRLDQDGPEALVQTPEPINRFPDAVAHLLRRLKLTMPSLGRRKLADVLARAGLHLAPSTVERLSKRARRPQPEAPAPVPERAPSSTRNPGSAVRAMFPHHLWHVDLTVVPTGWGFWVPWWPFSLPIFWPFAWHVAVVLDHFSRAVIATAVFDKEANAADIVALLDRAVVSAGRAPRHIVSDRGAQFQSEYRDWCKRNGVKPRFGAIA